MVGSGKTYSQMLNFKDLSEEPKEFFCCGSMHGLRRQIKQNKETLEYAIPISCGSGYFFSFISYCPFCGEQYCRLTDVGADQL